MKEKLERLAQEAVEWMSRQDRSLESELYLSAGRERSLEIKEGALEAAQEAQFEGAGLRLIGQGRSSFGCTSRLDLESIQALYLQIKGQIPFMPEDPFRSLPHPVPVLQDPDLEASLWDEDLCRKNLKDQLPVLLQMEAAAAAVPHIQKVLRVGYGEGEVFAVIANSLGILAGEKGRSASVGVETAAQKDSELQVGYYSQSRRFYKDLDFHWVAKRAAERTVLLLGGSKIPTQKMSIVLDPTVACEVFELLAGAVCADQVQKGKSLLKERLGSRIGSPSCNFMDDPRLPKGLASSVFDDEGLPSLSRKVVDQGVLRDYLYDSYACKKAGKGQAGSAGRPSFKGIPSPSPSNFFLLPGEKTQEEIFRATPRGLYILEVMGMHMSDPVSGEFSLGASGVLIENGELTRSVQGAMWSGNILELLEKIDLVGSDLTFYGGMGSPTVRAAEMTIC